MKKGVGLEVKEDKRERMRLRGGGRIQWGIDRCGEQVNGGSRDCRAHSAGGGGERGGDYTHKRFPIAI